MTASSLKPEIIDLTEPTVIELDSDGEVVQADGTLPTEATSGDASAPTKKKRKKKRRKTSSANAADNVDGEVESGSAETSQAVSRNSPSSSGIITHVATVEDDSQQTSVDGNGRDGGGKQTLADRLGEPSSAGRQDPTKSERRRRERKEDRRREDRERRESHSQKDRDRGEDKGERREKDRERNRRRSRSPRRHHDHDRERDSGRSRKRSRSREREHRKRKREEAVEDAETLFYEDLKPMDIPVSLKPPPPSLDHPSAPATHLSTTPSLSNGSSSQNTTSELVDALLLPEHVSVAAEGEDTSPLKLPSPDGSDDDDDYIQYLDYGNDDLKVRTLIYNAFAD